jgi:hypothetical protein
MYIVYKLFIHDVSSNAVSSSHNRPINTLQTLISQRLAGPRRINRCPMKAAEVHQEGNVHVGEKGLKPRLRCRLFLKIGSGLRAFVSGVSILSNLPKIYCMCIKPPENILYLY